MQVANKTPVTKDNEKGRENPGDVKSGGKSPIVRNLIYSTNSRARISAVTSCSRPFSPPSCDLQFSKSHIRNSIYREKTCTKLGVEPQWLLALNTQVMTPSRAFPGPSKASLFSKEMGNRWLGSFLSILLRYNSGVIKRAYLKILDTQ